MLAIFPGQIAPDDPTAEIFRPALGPSRHHWFGTTAYGQDIFSQLIWGTRQSLVIALAVGGARHGARRPGRRLGRLSRRGRGRVPLARHRCDPRDPDLPADHRDRRVRARAPASSRSSSCSARSAGRMARGSSARRRSRLRSRDFLESARVRGERKLYIILFEILPTMTSLIVASFLGAALYAVLTAAGLQFIGLGDPNSQSWGTMLYWAENNEALGAGMAAVGDRAGRLRRAARSRVRTAQLRVRRDQQPGAAVRRLERRRHRNGRGCAVAPANPDNILEVRGPDGRVRDRRRSGRRGRPRRLRARAWRVPRDRRRVRLRQVDAALRDRAAARTAARRRDRRRRVVFKGRDIVTLEEQAAPRTFAGATSRS